MKLAAMVAPTPVAYLRLALSNAVLRGKGHAVKELERPHPSLPEDEIRRITQEHAEIIESADVVHLLHPADCPFEERAECFKRMRGALVLESDDDLFAFENDAVAKDPVHLANMRAAERDLGMSSINEKTLANFASWLQGVDLVTTTTEHLASVFRAHGAREVAVCPNAMLPAFQRQRPHPLDISAGARSADALAILARAKRGGEAPRTIGWTGSISHKHDVAPALLALRRILSIDAVSRVVTLGPIDFMQQGEWKTFRPTKGQYARFRTVVGDQASDSVPFVLTTPDGQLAWTYYAALESFDATCAVIPLRDTPFNQSKSDVTLLSWSIQGIPSVVSRVGPYALAEQAGLPALYVDHHDVDAWTTAVRSLLYDRAKARELGEAARAWVLENRSFPKAVEPWERAYARALELKGLAHAFAPEAPAA